MAGPPACDEEKTEKTEKTEKMEKRERSAQCLFFLSPSTGAGPNKLMRMLLLETSAFVADIQQKHNISNKNSPFF